MNGKISNFSQLASIRRYVLKDGRANGIEVLDCDNGKIRFLLNVSHALDMMQLYHEGQNVSFVSKNGFVKENVTFLRRFEGGMLYSCGFDCVGRQPGYELHGNLHTLPAEILHACCDEKGIAVEAVIRDTALFGQNLVLRRRVTAAIGEDSVKIEDTLMNAGYVDASYALLYHINVGYPLLDEGAYIEADFARVEGRTDGAVGDTKELFTMTKDIPGLDELCFYLAQNTPKIALVNQKLGKRFSVSYSGDTLPELLVWKSMASGDYALGLEPCTTKLDGDFQKTTLGAQESVSFSVTLSVEKL